MRMPGARVPCNHRSNCVVIPLENAAWTERCQKSNNNSNHAPEIHACRDAINRVSTLKTSSTIQGWYATKHGPTARQFSSEMLHGSHSSMRTLEQNFLTINPNPDATLLVRTGTTFIIRHSTFDIRHSFNSSYPLPTSASNGGWSSSYVV